MIQHFDYEKQPIGDVTHFGGIPWSTPSLSPALIGIGYIIGPQLASINVAGGVIAWWILIPLLLFFDPDLAAAHRHSAITAIARLHGLVQRGAAHRGGNHAGGRGQHDVLDARVAGAVHCKACSRCRPPPRTKARRLDRTERDIPPRWVVLSTLVLVVPITAIYYYFTKGSAPAIVAAVIMTITGFFLSAVGGYLVGLVGSSNQPLSGLTLAALMIAALVMVAIGVKGLAGVAAVLGVASVVCVACSVSGSLIQDLKAGHLLGGTPWKMELVEIISVILLSFFLMRPIIALHEANLEHGRHRRPRAAGSASRIDGATRQRNRGRPDGLGTARHRRGVRSGAGVVRRALAHAGRGRHVSSVRYLVGDLRGRRA